MRVPPFLLILFVGSTPILLVALILSATNVELVAWRPSLAWSEQYGTLGGGIDNAVGAVTTDNSGVYAVGDLDLPISGNATSGTLFIRKYDSGGSLVWAHDQQSVLYDRFTGISSGNDGIYIVGNVNHTITVLKYDRNGNPLWTRQIGTFYLDWVGTYSTSAGTYVTGIVSHPITNQPFTGPVMFVREYDPSGSVIWTSEFSNDTNTPPKGIYADSSGVYVLTSGLQTGGFVVRYDLNGNQLPRVAGGGIGISGDGSSVYVTGQSQFNRFTQPPNGVLTKYRSDGSVDWTLQFDAADHSGVYDAQVSADSSGVYVSLRSTIGHAYVFKYDNHGNQLWSFEPPLSRSLGVVSSTIMVGGELVYWGGAIPADSRARSFAFLEGFGKESSLIFFGLQPPWSIIVIVGIGAFVTINIFLHLRRRRDLRRLGVERSNKIPLRVPKD